MQLCIVVAVVASLVSADFVSVQPAQFAVAKFIGVLLSMSIVVAMAWGISASTVANINCGTRPPAELMRQLHFWSRVHVGVWLAVSILIFTCFDWPQLIKVNWPVTGILGDEIVLLLPVIIPLLLSWATFHDIDDCLATEPITRGEYVRARVRYLLLPVLLPMLSVSGCLDLLEIWCPQGSSSSWTVVLRGLPLLAIIVTFPILLRWLWRAAPLASGPLRRRLLRAARNRDIHFSEIMVWDTRGKVANAFVSGLIPWWRSVLLSDGLLELLTDEETEAVFLHELGHVKLHHGLRLMMSVVVTVSAAVAIVWFGGETARTGDAWILASFLMVLLCFLTVGRYAWLLELEADMWAIHVGRCGRRRYFAALLKLADGDEDRSGWLHPSVSQRKTLLGLPQATADAWLQSRLRKTEYLLLLLPWFIAMVAALARM